MNNLQKTICSAFAVGLLVSPQALAQKPENQQITEADKQVLKNFMGAQKAKVQQATAVMHLRQIGLALFEFDADYGSFPNEKTAALVKEATDSKANLKTTTSNDFFYQLIAAKIIDTDGIFTLDSPKKGEEAPKPLESIKKCAFSYLTGINASGNPSRPLVLAPLISGKKTFDSALLGGKAAVLFVDCSAKLFPIEKDGRVMIDGMDIFDPAQPFWKGEVPAIAWPAE